MLSFPQIPQPENATSMVIGSIDLLDSEDLLDSNTTLNFSDSINIHENFFDQEFFDEKLLPTELRTQKTYSVVNHLLLILILFHCKLYFHFTF